MKKVLFSIILLMTLAFGASAQDKAFDEAVKKMITVSGGAEAFKAVIPQMISMVKQQCPDVPETFWNELQQEMEKSLFDKLVVMLVPIYQKHFTLADIREILKFYETPIGKKMAETSPKISVESMAVGQQWGIQMATEIQNKLKEKGYIK